MKASAEGVELGGLYQEIEKVGNHVTYLHNNERIVGQKIKHNGKLSRREYETISARSAISEAPRSTMLRNALPMGEAMLLSSQCGSGSGKNRMRIINETDDDQMQENSLSRDRVSTSLPSRKIDRVEISGRLIKHPGSKNQIKDMISSSHDMKQITLGVTQSDGFANLQR